MQENNNYSKSTIIKWAFIGLAILMGLWLTISTISTINQDQKIRNRFAAKYQGRTAYYDNLWKQIAQVGKVAVKVDSSNTKNLGIIMSNRKDSPGLMMKWVTESNPNASFSEVTKLYQNLARLIEANREKLFTIEEELQDIVREEQDLVTVFPNNVIFGLLGRPALNYKPITSDRTDDVIKTSKDNNVEVF